MQAPLIKLAKLKYPQAAIEDVDNSPSRWVNFRMVLSLALSDWFSSGHVQQNTHYSGTTPYRLILTVYILPA